MFDNSICFLHISDFHEGLPSQSASWDHLEKEFYDDLELVLSRVNQPIDAVLFTGDLTQSAEAEQFTSLTERLKKLAEFLALRRDDRQEPYLLVVPGNHDLEWLEDEQDVDNYYLHFNEPRWRDGFWLDRSYRRTIVNNRFRNYRNWLQAWYQSHPRPERYAESELIAGDFFATLQKGDMKLLVAGLNSAFLQLGRREYKGRLELDRAQIRALARKQDYEKWREEHHCALLMTHHPRDWLNKRSDEHFTSEILDPKVFAGHLHGHLHLPAANPDPLAMPNRNQLQAASLFGREMAQDGSVERIHGYTVGRVEVKQRDGMIRLWHRRCAYRPAVKGWRFGPDDSFDYDRQNQDTRPGFPFTALKELKHTHFLTAAFDGYYVPRELVEKELRAYLEDRTRRIKPPLVSGPDQIGKKTTWVHVRDQYVAGCGRRVSLATLALDAICKTSSGSEQCNHSLAQLIVAAVSSPEELAGDIVQRFQEMHRATWFTFLMQNHVLSRCGSELILAIYDAECLWKVPDLDPFKSLLRDWITSSQDGHKVPWGKLRIVALRSSQALPRETHSALFPLFHEIVVPPFTLDQTAELCRRHSKKFNEQTLLRLHGAGKGIPGFLLQRLGKV